MILHSGSSQFQFLEKDDSLLSFRNLSEAVEFLRRFRNNPAQMNVLRKLVADGSHPVHRMSTDEILKKVASLLVNGRLKILRSPQVLEGVGPGAEIEAEGAGAGTLPPVRNTSWIEIYLRNAKGEPVAGEPYRIKLPDASIREGNLDNYGHVEIDGINAGTCEVSFPALEDEDWEFQKSVTK